MVQDKRIFMVSAAEATSGSGTKIVIIESQSNRTIDGNDLTLAILAPVLYQSDIGCSFESYYNFILFHPLSF